MPPNLGKTTSNAFRYITLNKSNMCNLVVKKQCGPRTIRLPKMSPVPEPPKRLRDHKIIFPKYIDESCVCKPKINTPSLKHKIVTLSSYIASWMAIYCSYRVLAKNGVWGSQDETRPIVNGVYEALEPIFRSKKKVKTRTLSDQWNDFLWKIGSFICGNIRTEPTKIEVTQEEFTEDVYKLPSHKGLPTIP